MTPPSQSRIRGRKTRRLQILSNWMVLIQLFLNQLFRKSLTLWTLNLPIVAALMCRPLLPLTPLRWLPALLVKLPLK